MRARIGGLTPSTKRLLALGVILGLLLFIRPAQAKHPVAKHLPVIGKVSLPVIKDRVFLQDVKGGYAFIYGPKDGFIIVDVHDKTNPKILGITDELS